MKSAEQNVSNFSTPVPLDRYEGSEKENEQSKRAVSLGGNEASLSQLQYLTKLSLAEAAKSNDLEKVRLENEKLDSQVQRLTREKASLTQKLVKVGELSLTLPLTSTTRPFGLSLPALIPADEKLSSPRPPSGLQTPDLARWRLELAALLRENASLKEFCQMFKSKDMQNASRSEEVKLAETIRLEDALSRMTSAFLQYKEVAKQLMSERDRLSRELSTKEMERSQQEEEMIKLRAEYARNERQCQARLREAEEKVQAIAHNRQHALARVSNEWRLQLEKQKEECTRLKERLMLQESELELHQEGAVQAQKYRDKLLEKEEMFNRLQKGYDDTTSVGRIERLEQKVRDMNKELNSWKQAGMRLISAYEEDEQLSIPAKRARLSLPEPFEVEVNDHSQREPELIGSKLTHEGFQLFLIKLKMHMLSLRREAEACKVDLEREKAKVRDFEGQNKELSNSLKIQALENKDQDMEISLQREEIARLTSRLSVSQRCLEELRRLMSQGESSGNLQTRDEDAATLTVTPRDTRDALEMFRIQLKERLEEIADKSKKIVELQASLGSETEHVRLLERKTEELTTNLHELRQHNSMLEQRLMKMRKNAEETYSYTGMTRDRDVSGEDSRAESAHVNLLRKERDSAIAQLHSLRESHRREFRIFQYFVEKVLGWTVLVKRLNDNVAFHITNLFTPEDDHGTLVFTFAESPVCVLLGVAKRTGDPQLSLEDKVMAARVTQEAPTVPKVYSVKLSDNIEIKMELKDRYMRKVDRLAAWRVHLEQKRLSYPVFLSFVCLDEYRSSELLSDKKPSYLTISSLMSISSPIQSD